MRRRTRSRYYTIDAQNEEEFIQEYENMKKSRLSELNFKQKAKEYIPKSNIMNKMKTVPLPKNPKTKKTI